MPSIHHRSVHTNRPRLLRSRVFVPTEAKPPNDAVMPSHKLMIQNGLIFKTASGVYSLLPLAVRSLEKLTRIIDEEMQAIGGQKVVMPALIPIQLWKESGRLDTAGPLGFCLGPTHEEVITDIVRNSNTSYRHLPLLLYQITSKYRDEIRPRFGLMRGKEFTMKDMYSFHSTREDALKTYAEVRGAYQRIFDRVQVPYSIAEADSGAIGGNNSEEFHVISNSGEDFILSCECGSYISNVEKATDTVDVSFPAHFIDQPSLQKLKSAGIRNATVTYVQHGSSKEPQFSMIIHPQGRKINEYKVKDALGANEVRPCDSVAGEKTSSVLVDSANEYDSEGGMELEELVGVRDEVKVLFGDFRSAEVGTTCGRIGTCDCTESDKKTRGKLVGKRGIEVGHIFYLGQKYSKALRCTFDSPQAKDQNFEMGCYGIGVTRVLASVVESRHDDHGLNWPISIAPYVINIIPISSNQMSAAEELYDELEGRGLRGDIIIEDRMDKKPGFRMNDSRAMGFPLTIVIGKSFQEEGRYELQWRTDNSKETSDKDQLLSLIQSKIHKFL
ncbi:prolyl-tRNA synthetase [Planoprotostelium fungivorum]|uniref:proline--tRNA ligase n=1 Tax=Planoprotostelium fungivorum TaxID=1890364 RepID=A0A2P6N401_9EUKA|nr:prolyl-tRNA synthetase [Planoprotostelium fungivorum]PRP78666.1 prolyl-tRNA synthetase [Planoprotostelium fungivorum]